MALGHNPSIVTSNLSCYYDMYNTGRSWKGAPTTNQVSDAQSMANWNNYWYTNTNSAYFSTFGTEFGTIGYRFANQPSWNGIYRSVSIPSTGTYTFSAWYRYFNGSSNNNGGSCYVSGWGGSDSAAYVDKSKVGVWQRVSITLNCTNTSFTFYLISFGGTANGASDYSSWDVTMPQIEARSIATPFTPATRSNTQALLDLTQTNTITASSLTYNSDGTFSFDGISDYLSVGTITDSFLNAGSWTMSAWVKFTSVSKGTDNAIFGHGTSSYSNGLHLGERNNYAYFGFYANDLAGTIPLGSGVWNYITFTYNYATKLKTIYVNGVYDNSGGSVGYSGTGSNFEIGRYPWATSYRMYGSISAVQINGSALSAAEVAQNFNAQRGKYGI